MKNDANTNLRKVKVKKDKISYVAQLDKDDKWAPAAQEGVNSRNQGYIDPLASH